MVSLVSVARLVKSALETTPPVVWAFFFGLIIASVVFLARSLASDAPGRGAPREQSVLALWLFGGFGLALGLGLSALSPATVTVQWWMLVGGGMLAVTACILPCISGAVSEYKRFLTFLPISGIEKENKE